MYSRENENTQLCGFSLQLEETADGSFVCMRCCNLESVLACASRICNKRIKKQGLRTFYTMLIPEASPKCRSMLSISFWDPG